MTTTDSQRLARLMAAHEAMVPYWKDGAFNDAPAALAGEYADALLDAPVSYWQEVERLDPGTGTAMLDWAQGYIEHRDYPEFFAKLRGLLKHYLEFMQGPDPDKHQRFLGWL